MFPPCSQVLLITLLALNVLFATFGCYLFISDYAIYRSNEAFRECPCAVLSFTEELICFSWKVKAGYENLTLGKSCYKNLSDNRNEEEC